MPTQVQFRRGNTAQTAAFTGAVAELTVDTDKKVVVVHDGSTAGGFQLARESALAANLVFTQAAFDKANQTAQLAFTTVAANGTNLVADANNDTLTITANTANGIQILSTASTDTLDLGLKPSGVTSGTYGNTTTAVTITIDQFGRITSVSQTAITETDPQALAFAIALG